MPSSCRVAASVARCAAVGLLSLLAACGGGGGNDDPPPAPGANVPDPPVQPPPDPGPQPPAPDPGPQPPPATGPGLDARPTNSSCLAWEKPNDGATIQIERFTQLTFAEPVDMLQAPHDDNTWYVVEIGGTVRKFSGANPTSTSTFVDISGPVVPAFEAGLNGIAFHPDYPRDPRVFVFYNTGGGGLTLRLSSLETRDNGATLDLSTEKVLFNIQKEFSNHNGGHLEFGPDGYLYIGVGDGGDANDEFGPIGNGQRLTTMLGKMLRIDVDSAEPYAIPPSNPFAQNPRCPAAGRDSGNCPEIYAIGFRNPWRWSFDREDGTLWVGDVGQTTYEEVDIVELGKNYGWRCREGAHPFRPDTAGCSTATLTDPVIEYGRGIGQSVTGGFVYRGNQPTSLRGRYIFADFVTGKIFTWIPEGPPAPRAPTVLLDTELLIVALAEANDGELFAINYAEEGATLHRLVFAAPTGGGTVPTKLSQTGCVNPQVPTQMASGLVPYDINAPFWSDGAQKDRWLALPDGKTLAVDSAGDVLFPEGSVLVKNFRLADRLIETRLLMRHPDGTWGGYSYEWNAEQTDATVLRAGATRNINGQDWIFPSGTQCDTCHTSAANRVLGVEAAQLNRSITYAQTGRTANQLSTLAHISMFDQTAPDPTTTTPMPDPADTTAPLAARARAYLHSNCSQCHREDGPMPDIDFRYDTALELTNTCNVPAKAGSLGIPDAMRIAAGSSARSVVVARMNRRDQNQMPPLGSKQVDTAGVALISQWVDSLTQCPPVPASP